MPHVNLHGLEASHVSYNPLHPCFSCELSTINLLTRPTTPLHILFSHPISNFVSLTHIMGLKCHKVPFTLVVFFLGMFINNISFTSGVKTLDDGWSPISPSDPAMVDIAKFAVNAHNEGHPESEVVFDSLVSGWVSGYPNPTYNMTIAAKSDIVRKYLALLAERPYMNSLWLLDWQGPI
ncbi:hypothetical protein Hanom_Chr15g01389541 [Helianthus anomalus]